MPQLEMGLDGLFPFVGSEEHRTHSALVGDAPVGADQIQTLGHGPVGAGNGVVHLVDEGRHFEGHLVHAGLADFDPVVHRSVLRDQHAVRLVLLDLPAVGRMDLLEVDDVAVDFVPEALIDPVEGPSLGPEGRSGVAPEDQRDGPLPEVIGKCKRFTVAGRRATEPG